MVAEGKVVEPSGCGPEPSGCESRQSPQYENRKASFGSDRATAHEARTLHRCACAQSPQCHAPRLRVRTSTYRGTETWQIPSKEYPRSPRERSQG